MSTNEGGPRMSMSGTGVGIPRTVNYCTAWPVLTQAVQLYGLTSAFCSWSTSDWAWPIVNHHSMWLCGVGSLDVGG